MTVMNVTINGQTTKRTLKWFEFYYYAHLGPIANEHPKLNDNILELRLFLSPIVSKNRQQNEANFANKYGEWNRRRKFNKSSHYDHMTITIKFIFSSG